MSPRKPLGKQARELRSEQVLAAAALVFAEKGFHGATTKAIARAAQVSEGTIYRYFSSKRDLLVGLIGQIGDLSGLEQVSENHDAKAYYRTEAEVLLGRLWSTRRTWQAVLPEILVDQHLRTRLLDALSIHYSNFVEPYLENRIDLGQLRPIDDIPLTTRVLQSIPLGILMLMLLEDPVVLGKWNNLPEVMSRLVFDGLKGGVKND